MGKTPPLMKNLAFVFGSLTGLGTAYWFALRPQHLRWGADPAEVRAFWPGDDLIPRPQMSATHAVTIQAPSEANDCPVDSAASWRDTVIERVVVQRCAQQVA
jgi:hypothetical protein